MVVAAVLALVGGERGGPGLAVEGAVLADRLGVLVQDVGVEELARLCDAVLGRVGKVVLGLGSAGRGAETGVEGSLSEDLHAHVGVLVVAVKRSVDGGIAESDRRLVAIWCCDGLVNVAIRASDNNVEVAAVLANTS